MQAYKMQSNRLNREDKAYLKRWQRVGPLLEAIRYGELRRMTEQVHLKAMDHIWGAGISRTRRTTTGLVEWQRLMRKCRNS
jgi:hypothetical protein